MEDTEIIYEALIDLDHTWNHKQRDAWAAGDDAALDTAGAVRAVLEDLCNLFEDECPHHLRRAAREAVMP